MTALPKKLISLFAFAFLLSGFARADLLEVDESGSVAYFIFSSPNKVVRYDMASSSFLPEIPLPNIPTAAAPTNDKLIVAYDRSAYAIDLVTGVSSFIGNTSGTVTDVQIVGDAIYLAQGFDEVTARSLSDFSLIEHKSFWYGGQGAVSSATHRAILFRDENVSPADLRKIPLNEDGSMQSLQNSPYHGDYPAADQLYLFPDESRVIDNAGIIYFTSDMTYSGSVAGGFDDMTFWQNDLLIRRDNILYHFNSQLLDQGQMSLQAAPTKLLSYGDSVFEFMVTNDVVTANELDLSTLSQPQPGTPPSAESLPYQPEFIEFDSSTGNVYLLDRETLGLFVWSADSETYTNSMGLLAPPDWMTFSSAHDRLYLGYSSGAIKYVDLTATELSETSLLNLPQSVRGLKAAGNFLFAVDPSGAWSSHYSIDSAGTILDSEEWRNESNEYVWNPTTERIYHLRNGISPNDIEWAELDSTTGMLGAEGDSPYHSSEYAAAPLHIDPTGQLLLAGNGKFHDATTLTELNYLSNNITDATWLGDDLYTIHDNNGTYYLQQWSSSYERLANIELEAQVPHTLLTYDDRLIVIAEESVGPRFTVINPNVDSDNDGIGDLQDNCPATANETQDNFDGDWQGDVCDSDADNDGIPNTVEEAEGLDSLNASDANLDADGDGFSNLVEFRLGTELNNPDDFPVDDTPFSEDFEFGFFPLDFTQGIGSNADWYVDSSVARGQYSLRSGDIGDSEVSVVQWNFEEPLPAGSLTFDYYRSAETCCDGLRVTVGGSTFSMSTRSDQNWVSNTVQIPAGTNAITFTYRKDGSVSRDRDSVWIDNLVFTASPIEDPEPPETPEDPDRDGDGIPNDIEELYTALDPDDPTDAALDYDGDGVNNGTEVFSGYNPDQPTTFPVHQLMDEYFPLGDIVWVFSSESGSQLVTSEKLAGDGRSVKTDGGFETVFERRPDGVYMIEDRTASLSSINPGAYEWQVKFDDGLIAVPAEMQLGEVIQSSSRGRFFSDGSFQIGLEVTSTLELVEEGRVDFNGQSVPLMFIFEQLTYRFDDGYTDTTYLFRAYAKGIGEVLNSYSAERQLDQMRVQTLDESLATESRAQSSSDSGGGGATSGGVLMFLLLLAVVRKILQRPEYSQKLQ